MKQSGRPPLGEIYCKLFNRQKVLKAAGLTAKRPRMVANATENPTEPYSSM